MRGTWRAYKAYKVDPPQVGCETTTRGIISAKFDVRQAKASLRVGVIIKSACYCRLGSIL